MNAVTPAFDHLDTSTPAALWRPWVRVLPPHRGVGPHDHLLVLAAHPDDESLGAGALITDAARAGAQVTVVIATDGEGSHPDSPTHSRHELATIRRAEVHAAVGELAGQARLILLGLPDGALAEHRADLVRAVTDAVDAATVIVAPWRGDGHPDHAACGHVAHSLAQASRARLLEYPIWGWHWARPGSSALLDGPGWVAHPASEQAREAKRRALAAHVSQRQALSPSAGDEPVLSAAMLEHFSGDREVFLEAPPDDLPGSYFDRLYRRSADPWGLSTGFYESRKRALTTAVLPRPRFARAFEPGCALGLTTAVLAPRCDHLIAWDVSSAAVAATRARVAGLGDSVDVAVGDVPHQWPDGAFDLIVIGELGYYLADPTRLSERIDASLTPDGVLVAVHWRHPADGYPSDAATVHDRLGQGLHSVASHVEGDFLLDVWSRTGESVAAADGLLR